MAPKLKLHVEKVPLGYKQVFKSVNFPSLPQLYLDFIENKSKVREHLKDVEYEPKWDKVTNTSQYAVSNEEIHNVAQEFKESLAEFDIDGTQLQGLSFDSWYGLKPASSSNDQRRSSYSGNNSPVGSLQRESLVKRILHEGFDKPYSEVVNSSESPHGSLTKEYVPEELPQRPRPTLASLSKHSPASLKKFTKVDASPSLNDPFADEQDYKVSPSNTPPSSLPSKYSKRPSAESSRDEDTIMLNDPRERYEPPQERYEPSKYRYEPSKERYERSVEVEDDFVQEEPEPEQDNDPISAFLQADLGVKSKTSQSVYSSTQSNQHRSYTSSSGSTNVPNRSQYPSNGTNQPSRPVSIDEINRQNAQKTKVYNMTGTTKSDEDKENRRSYLMFQFKKLKKLHPEAVIPEFTPYTDLETLEREYNNQTRHLHIESNVENYKRYLTMGFGVIEFLVSRFLHFNEIEGFAAEQMVRMNQYDKILYELGEKYQPEDNKAGMSPELKLIGIVLFNAAVFVGMKMLMNGGGNAVYNSTIAPNIHQAPSFGQPNVRFANTPQPQRPPPQTSKRPMKGPDIDLDDFN